METEKREYNTMGKELDTKIWYSGEPVFVDDECEQMTELERAEIEIKALRHQMRLLRTELANIREYCAHFEYDGIATIIKNRIANLKL